MEKLTLLITTFNVTEAEMQTRLSKMNLEAFFIVRNQNNKGIDNTVRLCINGYNGIVYNIPNEMGASKNRNELLKLASSEYIIFVDDDMVFHHGELEKLINFIDTSQCDAVKYLVHLPNKVGRLAPKNKPRNRKKLHFLQCTDCGPWSYCFSRNFLIKNGLKFYEKIGPGTPVIKAGEDILFIKNIFKEGVRMVPYNQVVASVGQETSTWFTGFNDQQLIIEGGIYYILYKPFHLLFYIRHYIRFGKYYNSSFFECLKKMWEGKQYAVQLQREKQR